MTENLVDEERRSLFALVSASGRASSCCRRIRPSASTSFPWEAFCFFLFLLDLELPSDRNRLRKPMFESGGQGSGVGGREEVGGEGRGSATMRAGRRRG